MKRLRILTFIALLLAIIAFTIKNRKPSTVPAGPGLLVSKAWLTTNPHPLTPAKDIRTADQTFLTYPEWFLVFSPSEQANYFATHTSTTFPYVTHIKQMWEGYHVVNNQIKNNFPFNTGYHAMIWVIAGSTTIEYGIKSFYETIIGRITDTGTPITSEDKFNASYEKDYVKFIEALPWYEYNFNQQLKSLWKNTPISGPNTLRKLERRYYLTTELLVKSAYGCLIGLGTKSAYEEASLQTAVILNKNKAATTLPRYAAFNTAATQLAQQGSTFAAIAGNQGAIMLTVLTTQPLKSTSNLVMLFSQSIPTKPGLNRIAIVTTVPNLTATINTLLQNHTKIEHIYDY